MTRYSKHLQKNSTPQRERAAANQARNSAGGYTFTVDMWARLERFLILGAEGGTYYAAERKLVLENARCVAACLDEDGARAVETLVAVSEAGRAPKQSPTIFALALACSHPSEATRSLALAALPRVCRTGSQLFEFLTTVQELRGWGRGLRKAVCRWYTTKTPDALAYQVVKYRQRAGFSHRDALRLAGGAMGPRSLEQDALMRWITAGSDGFGARTVVRSGKTQTYDAVPREALPSLVAAFETLQAETSPHAAARLIVEHRMTHEMVPSTLHGSPVVWRALLEQMPMTAMLRNLGRLTSLGLVAQGSEACALVVSRLADVTRLQKARLHPLAVLVALNTYRMGRGVRGSMTWEPVPQVVSALEGAFELTFGSIPATKARTLFALDVSGSMGCGQVAGMTGITPRVGSAAMAMATMRVEPNWTVMGFSHKLVPIGLHPRMSLGEVIKTVSSVPMGATDCALPMLWAARTNTPVDAFVVYTDNETWFGQVHPHQALDRYRQKTGLAAKLIVVGMTATKFSIASPDDPGMLDVVGFDTAAPRVMADFITG
jgi:60 kDa SS-A/Ro ribonucleoprotein